jgi:hypothetical protein
MTWTTDKPTEPGWYWLRHVHISAEIGFCYQAKKRWWVATAYRDHPLEMSYFMGFQWSGPIPEPED